MPRKVDMVGVIYAVSVGRLSGVSSSSYCIVLPLTATFFFSIRTMKQALEAAMQHADQNSHQANPSGQPPVLAAADRLIQAAMGFGRPYLM